jgi:hypothetical protein
MHAAPPPPGILAKVKPAQVGYQTVQGHRFYCRRWDGKGRFAIECVLVKPAGS